MMMMMMMKMMMIIIIIIIIIIITIIILRAFICSVFRHTSKSRFQYINKLLMLWIDENNVISFLLYAINLNTCSRKTITTIQRSAGK